MALSLLFVAALLSGPPQSQSLTVFETHRPPPTPRTAPAAPGSDAAPAAQLAEVQQICRDQAITGTRFPVRVCRSTRQTEADRAESRDMLREIQRQRKQEVPE